MFVEQPLASPGSANNHKEKDDCEIQELEDCFQIEIVDGETVFAGNICNED